VVRQLLFVVSHAEERRTRIEMVILEFLQEWSLASVAEAPQTLRGINPIEAVMVMSEIGNLRRFKCHASA
jgi:hypothetical protein